MLFLISSPMPDQFVHFTFDRRPVQAREGQSVAAALLAAGHRDLRLTSRLGQPRGAFCGMGVCFDCLVQVDGCANVRACQVAVADGMQVESRQQFPPLAPEGDDGSA